MNRRTMSKSNPLVRPVFKTPHGDPRCPVDRDPLVELALQRIALDSAVCWFHRTDYFAVRNDFDPVQRHATGRRTMNNVFTRTRISCPKRMAGRMTIHLDKQHWPGRHKTAPRIQTAEPRLIGERLGTLNIDTTKSQRDRMNAGSGAGSRPQPKPAIQQPVVILKPRIDPTPLRQTLRVALSPHVFRGRFAPAAECKRSPPDMVIRQLIKVRLHDRDQHHRPRPVVFVEFDQSTLAMN